jgi:phage terminase small subunit
MALNNRQTLFVNEYLKTFNATKAALAAGYSEKTAHSQGWENLRKPEISEAISQRLSESAMTADEVLMRLADQARGTIEPFLRQREDDENITIDLTTERAKKNIHLIKKISQKRVIRTRGDDSEEDETTLTIELHDPQAALTTLAKKHGLLTDKIESIIGNFDIDYSKLTVDQLSRIAKGENVLKVILDGYAIGK